MFWAIHPPPPPSFIAFTHQPNYLTFTQTTLSLTHFYTLYLSHTRSLSLTQTNIPSLSFTHSISLTPISHQLLLKWFDTKFWKKTLNLSSRLFNNFLFSSSKLNWNSFSCISSKQKMQRLHFDVKWRHARICLREKIRMTSSISVSHIFFCVLRQKLSTIFRSLSMISAIQDFVQRFWIIWKSWSVWSCIKILS